MSFMSLTKNGFKSYQDKIQLKLDSVRSFFQSELYPAYQEAQNLKFATGGKSEGLAWPVASTKWVTRKIQDKQHKPSIFPGGDRSLLHTGKLAANTVGIKKDWHVKLITATSFKVGVLGEPYARFVDQYAKDQDVPGFMEFGKNTVTEWRNATASFLRRTLAR